MNRRSFQKSSVAMASATLSSPRATAADSWPGHVTLKAGDLTAVVGNNSTENEYSPALTVA